MRRILAVSLFGLALTATTDARAQFFYLGPGSTPQGDYLRGLGVAGYGMGYYNLATAQAIRINVGTEILLNEYIASVLKAETRERARRYYGNLKDHMERYKKLLDRYLNNANDRDVLNGESLNAQMNLLKGPEYDSAFRSPDSRVPLAADMVRQIPFMLGEKGAVISMRRFQIRDREWGVLLNDPKYSTVKRNYKQALDRALDLQIEGKLTPKVVKELQDSVARMKAVLNLDQQNPRAGAGLFMEAFVLVGGLETSSKHFELEMVGKVVSDLAQYSGTTVDDLRVFMRSHGLQFAVASTVDEKTLYPEINALLRQQRDLVSGANRNPDPEPRR